MELESELTKMQRSFEVSQKVEEALQGKTNTLFIKINKTFDLQLAHTYGHWLLERAPNAVSTGAYALLDLLQHISKEGTSTYKPDLSVHGMMLLCKANALADMAACTLLVDIAFDVIRPGDDQVKASLLSLMQIANALSMGLVGARLSKANVLRIKPPFVANLLAEAFVTVTAISEKEVSFLKSGCLQRQDRNTFTESLSGFVLTPKQQIEPLDARDVSLLPDGAQVAAFVWG